MSPKRETWKRSFGPYGNRIRVFEEPSGIIYATIRDPSMRSGERTQSLRHRDKGLAERWGREQVAKLLAGDETLRDPTPAASRIIGHYLTHQTPDKGRSEQQADRRRATMWLRVLGPTKDLSKLTMYEWKVFIEVRRSGAIDPTGVSVPPDQRKPIRDGTVWGDLVFLKTALNWATRWQDREGRYLMRENPARGFEMPIERNPRRPVANRERFERIRAVADQVRMAVGRGRSLRTVRTYLPEIMDLVAGTGRRISAVLALKCDDLKLNTSPGMPFGAIKWPADTDKMGKEWLVPISKEVRDAIGRVLVERPLIGQAYLFPSPLDPSKPVSKELASSWLERAERVAGVEKQVGSLWHAYRRGWATARKHLPDVDVAAAGGWSDLTSLKTCYQQSDEATMYQVVSEPTNLRGTAGTRD